MGHLTKELPWCLIDINTATGHVILQERWKYNWRVAPGQSAWTEDEKTFFHTSIDAAIGFAWSDRVKLSVAGTSEFARTMAGSQLPLTLDIRRVNARNHWSVQVTKIALGTMAQSGINWNARRITLDSNDFDLKRLKPISRPKLYQVPVAHEFGHTIGNVPQLGRGDEYVSGSPHQDDLESMMNDGHELRKRHFRTVLEELNKMIPDTEFTIGSIS